MRRLIAHYILLFLGTVFSLFWIACDSKEKWNGMVFYQVEKSEELTEKPLNEDTSDDDTFTKLHEKEERRLDVRVSMQFMQSNGVTNDKACKLINDQLIEILLKQSSELTADEAVDAYIEDVKQEFHCEQVANVYHDELTGRAEYGKEGVINYRMSEEVFTGGAHPSTVTTILRFNAMTGELITLDEVFPLIQQSQLQNRLLSRLMENNDVHSIEELHEKGILEMTDMFVSSNFALREDSIEFHYNEYDLAPYAYGAFTICMSYDEVKDIIGITWENRK